MPKTTAMLERRWCSILLRQTFTNILVSLELGGVVLQGTREVVTLGLRVVVPHSSHSITPLRLLDTNKSPFPSTPQHSRSCFSKTQFWKAPFNPVTSKLLMPSFKFLASSSLREVFLVI